MQEYPQSLKNTKILGNSGDEIIFSLPISGEGVIFRRLLINHGVSVLSQADAICLTKLIVDAEFILINRIASIFLCC